MPAPNAQRRALLTDSALGLLAEAGVHGVTHRNVDRRAGLPAGTTSNYFRSREALLVAAAHRVAELHHADMAAAAAAWNAAPAEHLPPGDTAAVMTELITASLVHAATTARTRYLAVFELRLESLRCPALVEALAGIVDSAATMTAAHHAELGIAVPADRIPVLIRLYGGLLFTLLTEPPGTVTADAVRPLVASAVHGALR